ncbi:acid phosphatase [Fragilaria crotonensis]|nr:acid phosphatase [Fragilaria crotonensis]
MLSPSSHILGVCTLAIFAFSTIYAHRVDIKDKPTLSFNEHGLFKILQLTDLHLGEAPSSDWGPEADRKTLALIRALTEFESPDLIVLGGDQITANNIDANATVYYDLIDEVFESLAIPYAIIFGNHDDADLELRLPNGTDMTIPAKTSRHQLFQSERRHALVGKGRTIQYLWVSNYMIPSIAIEMMRATWPFKSCSSIAVEEVYRKKLATANLKLGIDQNVWTVVSREGIAPLEFDRVGEVSVLGDDLHLWRWVTTTATAIVARRNTCFTFAMVAIQGMEATVNGRGGRVFEIKALGNTTGRRVEWRSWVRMHNGDVTDEYNVFDEPNEPDS